MGDNPKEVCKSVEDKIKKMYKPSYMDEKGRVVGPDGGIKNDAEKPRWDLLPFETIERVVKVMTYGASKYMPDNWKEVEWRRNFSALLRHLTAWLKGEDIDPDSGFHHLDHALTDLVFVVWKVCDEDLIDKNQTSVEEWM